MHYGPVMPYSDIDLNQHRLSLWHVAWWYQAKLWVKNSLFAKTKMKKSFLFIILLGGTKLVPNTRSIAYPQYGH